MKNYYLTIVLLLVATLTFAVPAKRTPFTVTQPDGTILTLQQVGDETLHYYLNVATGEKMCRGLDGNYHPINNSLFSNMLAKAKERRQQNAERRQARMAKINPIQKSPARIGTVGGMIGKKKGIVILVNFKDVPFNSAHNQTTFNDMFNKEGYNEYGHIGSVHDYFHDQSYGQFDLSFDVVGPVTLSNNMAYYGGNNSSGNDLRPGHMAKEACQLADKLDVNFADYDWDGDGYVDQVFIIYAGYGENFYGADSNTIWPHEWDLYNSGAGSLSVDGVTVNTYACAAELYGTSGTSLCGIGTACHEFSHCLGYPDSYDTDYSGGVGMDSYDIMCGGSYNGPKGRGEVPAGYTAYERLCAGWLQPIVLNDPANISEMPDLGTYPISYIIYNPSNSNEFFLFENRQASCWFRYFDNSIAGHGLFVTHIDYKESVWSSNKPNDDPAHQRLTWIPADGIYSISNIETDVHSDFFPGTKNITSFTNSSHTSVNAKWFTGTYNNFKPLTEITETNGLISFKFDGGIQDDGSRYTITFNAGAGSCSSTSWTQTEFGQKANLPSCTINSDDWTFVGWASCEVSETSAKPTLYTDSFTPTTDVTLYAVYSRTESGSSASGSYTLDYSAEKDLQEKSLGYGNPITYTATDKSTWVVKAYKNNGLQINNKKNASIKVPDCPTSITSIDVTDSTAKILKFSTTDYTGSNTPTAVATSASNTSVVLNLSGKNLTTGYIYTTDGATVITKIVVNYGGDGSFALVFATNPAVFELGDINADGSVTIADLALLIQYLNGTTPENFYIGAADADASGEIDINDVFTIANICLGSADGNVIQRTLGAYTENLQLK